MAGNTVSGLRDHLQTIYDQHQRLTPKLVVDTARDTTHPLHDRFEWDNSIAGEKWRIHQARDLIVSYKISYTKRDGNPGQVRAWQSVRRPTGYTYEPTEEVVKDPMATRILLADMEREWKALKDRYDRFDEFRELVLSDLG